eukprot:2418108-Rhodomonas_salina.1
MRLRATSRGEARVATSRGGDATRKGVEEFVERGLLAGERGAGQRVGEALAWLEQRGMLREGEDGVYAPTLLGKG